MKYQKGIWVLTMVGICLCAICFAEEERVIGEIKITGNEKTKPQAIIAETLYKSGDKYTEDVPAEVQRRIMNLGYFQYVKVTTSPAGEKVNINIEVKERMTYGFYPIVDIRKGDDILGAEIAENNLFGYAKSISGTYQWTRNSDSFSASYYDRHFLWSDFSLGLGGGVSEVTEKWYNTAGTFLSETDRDTTSGYIQGGYWFSYKGRGFLTLSTRDDDYKVSKGAYKPIEGKTNKIGLSLVYDDTKYGIYTLEGPYIWGSFEKGGKWLDGDFNFKKMSLGGVYYWNTREDHTMIISASAGKGWDLPSHEFFAVGGLGSLRGYDAGAYQGDRYGLARVEYRVPVWKPTFAGYSGTLSVLGFVDGGYAWPEGKGVNLSDLVMGAGGGLRFYFNEFQRGVIALDIAYGFETEDFKVYLGFGATF